MELTTVVPRCVRWVAFCSWMRSALNWRAVIAKRGRHRKQFAFHAPTMAQLADLSTVEKFALSRPLFWLLIVVLWRRGGLLFALGCAERRPSGRHRKPVSTSSLSCTRSSFTSELSTTTSFRPRGDEGRSAPKTQPEVAVLHHNGLHLVLDQDCTCRQLIREAPL
jgi:hypothetical protein